MAGYKQNGGQDTNAVGHQIQNKGLLLLLFFCPSCRTPNLEPRMARGKHSGLTEQNGHKQRRSAGYGAAALKLDNKTEYKYISRYINLVTCRLSKAAKQSIRTVEVTSNKVKVYFVMNPFLKENISVSRKPESFRNTKAIILVDT